MKSNVENMESEMDQLSQSIKNISNVTTSVNSALGPKRDKIRQLTGVHDLLKKVFKTIKNLFRLIFNYSLINIILNSPKDSIHI